MSIDDRISEVLERDGAYVANEHRRAIYRAGAEDMRERCAVECERMMMYPGGRQESAVHQDVWAAAKAIRALDTNP